MKILIITVGNRQIGWRCQDGVVRCPGVSANPKDNTPDHVSHLYAEMNVEQPKQRYYARHLGKLLYDECQKKGDFSQVELLLDRNIIEQEYQDEERLIEVWLIGTNQSEDVSQDYRSSDTLWLTELMAGKIKQTWQNLQVHIENLQGNLSDTNKVREKFAEFVMHLTDRYKDHEKVTILIENKGSVPAIATSLEIYLAALTRSFTVERITPQEPDSMFDSQTGSARIAEKFSYQLLNQYFFPLERQKIISAWEKGDFGEAKVWLEGHKNKLAPLDTLASYLNDARNNELRTIIESRIKEWLNSKHLKKLASPETIELWKNYHCLKKNQGNTTAIIWESAFSIPIDAKNERFTTAFFTMAQTLERLLFELYKKDKWLEKQWITIPEDLVKMGIGRESFTPRLEEMSKIWSANYNLDLSFSELIDVIRTRRNKIVHEAKNVTFTEIRDWWRKADLDAYPIDQALLLPLRPICSHFPELPEKPLLLSLYEWALEVLKNEI
jgi:hypothetical protein